MKKKIKIYVPVLYSKGYLAESCPRIDKILKYFVSIHGDEDVIQVCTWDGDYESLSKDEPSLVMFSESFKIFTSQKNLESRGKKSFDIVHACLVMGHFLFWDDKQLVLPINVKAEFRRKPTYLKPPKDQMVLRYEKIKDKKGRSQLVERWSPTWALGLECSVMEANLYRFLGFEGLRIKDMKYRN